jgi:hypothetical protein
MKLQVEDKAMKSMKLKTDFENIIVKATQAEDELLEASIKTEGVREPIKVWNGSIIDGHRRYRFAQKHGKPFQVEELQFEDRQEAEIWIHKLQLCRRNLSPDHYAYHRGKLYEAQKQKELGRPKGGQNVHLSKGKAAVRIAKEHGVTEKTVRRDAAFAKGVDRIEEVIPGFRDPDVRKGTNLTKMNVVAVGQMKPEELKDYQAKVKRNLENGEPPPKPQKQSFGKTTYPPCADALSRLEDAMNECRKYTIDEYSELLTRYDFLEGHKWMLEKRFSQYRQWLDLAVEYLEPLVKQIGTWVEK